MSIVESEPGVVMTAHNIHSKKLPAVADAGIALLAMAVGFAIVYRRREFVGGAA